LPGKESAFARSIDVGTASKLRSSALPMTRWRNTLPVGISIGLIAWLLSRISWVDLLRAVAELRWQPLVPLTLAMVVAQYLWDAFCLPTVFTVGSTRLTYLSMLRVRGRSYLLGVLNQGLGQAAIAWDVSRIQGLPLVAALSRSLLLGCHDGLVLSAAALGGLLWSGNLRALPTRWFCVVLFAVLLGLLLLVALLPAAWRRRCRSTPWVAFFDSWDLRRSLRLLLLRVGYFAIAGSYLAVALRICRLDTEAAAQWAAIPLVLLAGILPSASGLGTRETALYLLVPADRPESLVAMGLIWSSGLLVVRLSIGLAWLWLGGNEWELMLPKR